MHHARAAHLYRPPNATILYIHYSYPGTYACRQPCIQVKQSGVAFKREGLFLYGVVGTWKKVILTGNTFRYMPALLFVPRQKTRASAKNYIQLSDNCILLQTEGNMQFLTIRELSKSPKEALIKLNEDRKVVLTNNGKPQALIFRVDGNNLEKTLSLLQKLEFMQNLTDMRLESMKNGNSKMSLDEINAEIKAVRKKRRSKEKK